MFSKGDYGKKFYIILKGSVKVLMPKQVLKETVNDAAVVGKGEEVGSAKKVKKHIEIDRSRQSKFASVQPSGSSNSQY